MWHRRQELQLGFVNYGICVNLHQNFRADEATHLYHGASGANVAKCLAVCPPYRSASPMLVTQITVRTTSSRRAPTSSSALRKEDVLGLAIGVGGRRIATRGCSSDMHLCPDTYRAAIIRKSVRVGRRTKPPVVSWTRSL